MMDHRLLRLTLASSAHLGSSWGEAALDRPTQTDVLRGLPLLPASAIKGVLAGSLGDVAEKGENIARESRYGSPDRGDQPGSASEIVVGDGRPLCFPVRAIDGSRIWIFPAETVAWAIQMTAPDTGLAAEIELVQAIENSPSADVLSPEPVPRIGDLPELERLPNVSAERATALTRLLGDLAGSKELLHEAKLVASSRSSLELWRAAADRRSLTALDSDRKVVESGFLRTIELVPEGSVFLSLVSLLGNHRPPMEPVQIGAWEGLGLGITKLSWTGRPSAESRDFDATTAARPLRGPGRPPSWAMRRALAAVDTVAATDDRALTRATWPAIRSFAWQFRVRGAQAALAFELAKARPHDPEPSPDHRAHRWLLLALLMPEEESEIALAMGPCRLLLDWLDRRPFAAVLSASERAAILLTWSWLRRYAELGLPESAQEGAAG